MPETARSEPIRSEMSPASEAGSPRPDPRFGDQPLPDSVEALPSFLATAREQGWDTRPVLLRVQTDLFVNATARTPDMVAAYEALAVAMIPLVDADTAQTVAGKVAGLIETPDSVRAALMARGGGAAAACIAARPDLGSLDAERIAQDGPPGQALALTQRADLPQAAVASLLARNDSEIDLALARPFGPALPADALRELIDRARLRRTLARALLARDDLSAADKAVLYAHAERDQRAAIREGVDALVALQPGTARLPTLSEDDVTRLLITARTRDTALLRTELAALAGLPDDAIALILADRSCDLLALLLIGLGLTPEDGAIVFISGDPAIGQSVQAVFALVETMRATSRATVERIIAAACGLGSAPPARIGTHVPTMDPAVSRPNDPSRRSAPMDAESEAIRSEADAMTEALRRFLGGRRPA